MNKTQEEGSDESEEGDSDEEDKATSKPVMETVMIKHHGAVNRIRVSTIYLILYLINLKIHFYFWLGIYEGYPESKYLACGGSGGAVIFTLLCSLAHYTSGSASGKVIQPVVMPIQLSEMAATAENPVNYEVCATSHEHMHHVSVYLSWILYSVSNDNYDW